MCCRVGAAISLAWKVLYVWRDDPSYNCRGHGHDESRGAFSGKQVGAILALEFWTMLQEALARLHFGSHDKTKLLFTFATSWVFRGAPEDVPSATLGDCGDICSVVWQCADTSRGVSLRRYRTRAPIRRCHCSHYAGSLVVSTGPWVH